VKGFVISFNRQSSFGFGIVNFVLTLCRCGLAIPFYINILLRFLKQAIIKIDYNPSLNPTNNRLLLSRPGMVPLIILIPSTLELPYIDNIYNIILAIILFPLSIVDFINFNSILHSMLYYIGPILSNIECSYAQNMDIFNSSIYNIDFVTYNVNSLSYNGYLMLYTLILYSIGLIISNINCVNTQRDTYIIKPEDV
jgi:hypothetical protein